MKRLLHRGVTVDSGSSEAVLTGPWLLKFNDGWREKASELSTNYKLGVLSLLLLIGGGIGVVGAGQLISARIVSGMATDTNIMAILPNKNSALNKAIAQAGLQTEILQIVSQPAHLTVNGQQVAISPDTIKGWLNISSNSEKSEYDVHSNENVIVNSLLNLANQQATTPINEVVASPNGAQEVLVNGANGTTVSNADDIKTQAQQVAKSLLSGKGFNVNVSLATAPYQTLTPANFPKLLQADITSMKMYAYQNGQLIQTFLISAGAPATPTPIGEYHIYAKYAVQTMKGFNVNGTPYVQPNVEWVNYFTGSDAVHGVYWHPLSWFGAHNSSHGCVGIPDNQAEWVYNWAPIGTTVITTLN